MRFVLTLLCFFILSCSPESSSKKSWDPELARSDAKDKYEENGYGPLTITDGKGKQFHGVRTLDQETTFCALDDKDQSLYVFKVESIEAEHIRMYVTNYNDEMLRMLARDRGCLR